MPPPGQANTPYNTSSVDLRLCDEISVPKSGLSLNFDLGGGNLPQTLAAVCETRTIPDDGWLLKPQHFVLGRTIEAVSLPLASKLAARIEGRSSFARTGLLIHFTAPTIHANFTGTITLEMINLGPLAIRLIPGARVCQLIIETVEGDILPADSQFHGQSTPTGA